jgi:hypothetical protein
MYFYSTLRCGGTDVLLIWVFLAHRDFAAKSPVHGYWILLDSLGFSRAKRASSIGYGENPIKDFSHPLFRAVRIAGMARNDLGLWKGRGVHLHSLT